jgi:hypothetical protein
LVGLNVPGVLSLPFESSIVPLLPDSVVLQAGKTYRVTLEATGAGSIQLNGLIPDSSAFMSAMPWGANCAAIQRQNLTGAFTELSNGQQYCIGLLIDAVAAGPRARYILGGI